MKELVVILIIAHKQFLNENEKKSLNQCYRILNNYPIKLICPEGLNISEYQKICPKVKVEFINPKWHSNYEMFNRLKIDSFLYKKYINYQYVLFYELDAWVFRDELQYWCKKDYDFIGAPWFDGWSNPVNENTIIGIGNGGFSLRNVGTSLRLTRRINNLKKIRQFWYQSRLQGVIRFEKFMLYFKDHFKIKNIRNYQYIFINIPLHEDHYWTLIVTDFFTDYKVASIEDAIKFSFEGNPSLLFKMNGNLLPFGCHAWEKYEPGFWSRFISFPDPSKNVNN